MEVNDDDEPSADDSALQQDETMENDTPSAADVNESELVSLEAAPIAVPSLAPVQEEEPEPVPSLKVLQPKFKGKAAKPLAAKAPVGPATKPSAPIAVIPSALARPNVTPVQGGWLEAKKNIQSETTETPAGLVNMGKEEDIKKAVFEENGTVLMYWLDAFEGKDGVVFLFGKVRGFI